ncbi:alpha/beta hydrolase [Cecembia sp.]|uniref:alpha/beta fold hydrolase n=1 Tax=Cecembia sp. TaxID=1898110 RepID=UPI0025B8C97C|nr:alpha/beta hydrolase [Cecembia sp.]
MKKLVPLFLLPLFWSQSFAQSHQVPTSDGELLHITVKGNGIPCLYLHGGPGSGSWWMEKFMGEELEQHFTMIYLDQRGVARSSGTENSNYFMERLVKEFEEIREFLGIENWLTMGHSFGGLLQMGYALRYPESIRGMLMINTALHMQECFETSWCPKALEFSGKADELSLCTDTTSHFVDRWQQAVDLVKEENVFWKMGYAEEENMHIMNATFGEIPNWNGNMGNIVMNLTDYHINFKPLTSNVQAPVLFFYGRSDWMIGPNHFEGLAFPNMVLWGSEVGHMPFMEGREDLMQAIRVFLEAQELANF